VGWNKPCTAAAHTHALRLSKEKVEQIDIEHHLLPDMNGGIRDDASLSHKAMSCTIWFVDALHFHHYAHCAI
jgi:hypothetical protein